MSAQDSATDVGAALPKARRDFLPLLLPVALALAALSLAFAWGAWTLQPWAWPLGVVLAAGSIIYALVLILGGASIVSEAITIVLYGAVLYYLNQPGIKSLFGRA